VSAGKWGSRIDRANNDLPPRCVGCPSQPGREVGDAPTERNGRAPTLDLPITRRMLGVELDGTRLCPVPGHVCPVQTPGAGELSDRRQRSLAYRATCYHVRTELD
jgi:hypothetical protein